ncbi:MAG TPA: chalcone isomerase family protein [Gammaproteobacteria bacterium]|nr:chalcone isomerase family protein [Gammaproteobacteria bacterium]
MKRTISTLASLALATVSVTAIAATPPQPASQTNPPTVQTRQAPTPSTNSPIGSFSAPATRTGAPQPMTSALPQPASGNQAMPQSGGMPATGAMANQRHMNAPKLPARTVHNVRVPGDITYHGWQLALNGAGVHTTWWFFNKYVAALYLPKPTDSAADAISGTSAKAIWLSMLTNMKAQDFVSSLHKAFQNNRPNSNQGGQNGANSNNPNANAGNQGAMQNKWQQFSSFFTDLKKNDKVIIGYIPGKGTGVTINGEQKGVVPGEMFARAIFSIWLGGNPVDSGLKQNLLGKKSS